MRYGLIPYIKQITFRLWKVKTDIIVCLLSFNLLNPKYAYKLYKNTNKALTTSSHDVSAVQERAFSEDRDWPTDNRRIRSADAPDSCWHVPGTVTEDSLDRMSPATACCVCGTWVCSCGCCCCCCGPSSDTAGGSALIWDTYKCRGQCTLTSVAQCPTVIKNITGSQIIRQLFHCLQMNLLQPWLLDNISPSDPIQEILLHSCTVQ